MTEKAPRPAPAEKRTKPFDLTDEAVEKLAGGTKVYAWEKVQELRSGR